MARGPGLVSSWSAEYCLYHSPLTTTTRAVQERSRDMAKRGLILNPNLRMQAGYVRLHRSRERAIVFDPGSPSVWGQHGTCI
jgi:hypothetical protein